VRERELEIKAIEERIAAGDHRCPVCHAEVDSSYLVCPVCTTKLKQSCVSCGAPLEPIWQVCPYCETPIEPAEPGTPPALGTRRARRSGSRH
jgi:predicted amidophosphoribosyltransferase